MNSDSVYMIALYIRLSTEDSKVGSFSIENQKRVLHQYVDAMEGIKNVDVLEFVDNGYSGTNFERPAVQELLDMVREGKINCIIVKDFTRFGRNSIEVGYFMERVFPIYGVRFISINDDFDSDKFHGDTGGINVAFKYLISEFYSRDLSIKYKSAKYVKYKRGEYQSTLCPYGYQKSADGRMEPDVETAPNVRLIFEMAQNGMSTKQIIDELFARKIPTPGEYKTMKGIGKHDVSRCRGIWIRSTLLRMLRDERYTGVYIMGKRQVTEVGGHQMRMKDESEWIKIPDHHPPIISREVFEQVQARLPPIRCVKKNVNLYPLREKVFCGCCHHAMPRTANKNHVFQCRYTLADENEPCYDLHIAEADLEAMIYDVLSKHAQIILNVDNLADAKLLDVQLAKQAECNEQVANFMEQKRALYERFLLQKISAGEYKAQKAAIDVDLNHLKRIQSAVAAQTAQMQMDEKSKNVRTELAQAITRASSLTAELAGALVDRVYIYPGNQVEIIWKTKDFCIE